MSGGYLAENDGASLYAVGNSGTSKALDFASNGKHQSVTLTGNCTFTFTAPVYPCTVYLKLTQDGTGSRTVTWPAAVKWASGTAPTLTTTAAHIDIIRLFFDGTNYYGQAILDVS